METEVAMFDSDNTTFVRYGKKVFQSWSEAMEIAEIMEDLGFWAKAAAIYLKVGAVESYRKCLVYGENRSHTGLPS